MNAEAAGTAVAAGLTATAWVLHLHRSRRGRLAGAAELASAAPAGVPHRAGGPPNVAATIRPRSARLLAAAVVVEIGAASLVVVGGNAGGAPVAEAGPAPFVVQGPEVPELAATASGDAPIVAPVRLDIAKVAVSAAVHPVGLLGDGTMEVPTDYDQIGWYTGLEAPGHVGTSVVVGHLDSHRGPAVFYRLRELHPGDEVSVTLADGSALVFVVERSATFPKDRFPTIDVYSPTDRPTLRLITCGGDFDRKRKHYRDNTVVYANLKEA